MSRQELSDCVIIGDVILPCMVDRSLEVHFVRLGCCCYSRLYDRQLGMEYIGRVYEAAA